MIDSTLRWPPERFYWAVLESQPCSGELPIGLLPGLEDMVPAPDLHAVCTPLDEHRVAVCALPSAELGGIEPSVTALLPTTTPEFISAAPERFNLLVGSMEPRRLRHARMRRHALRMAAALTVAALVSLGFTRRAHYWNELATRNDAAASALARVMVPGATDLGGELARVRASSGTAAVHAPAAAPRLAGLLAAWPAKSSCKPLSLAVDPDSIAISLTVEGGPSEFLNAFHAPDGWMMDEPRVNTAGPLTRVNLHLQPKEGAGT